MSKVPPKDLQAVQGVLEMISEAELAVGEFYEAVQSDDVDFNELLNRIREETFFHRERISRRIKEKAYSAIILSCWSPCIIRNTREAPRCSFCCGVRF